MVITFVHSVCPTRPANPSSWIRTNVPLVLSSVSISSLYTVSQPPALPNGLIPRMANAGRPRRSRHSAAPAPFREHSRVRYRPYCLSGAKSSERKSVDGKLTCGGESRKISKTAMSLPWGPIRWKSRRPRWYEKSTMNPPVYLIAQTTALKD